MELHHTYSPLKGRANRDRFAVSRLKQEHLFNNIVVRELFTWRASSPTLRFVLNPVSKP